MKETKTVIAKPERKPAGIVSLTGIDFKGVGLASLAVTCVDCDGNGSDPGCDSGCVCDGGSCVDSGDCYGGYKPVGK